MDSIQNHSIWNGQTFWHGTSTVFLKSILETGLGAINPSRDWRLLELLKFLYQEVIRSGIDNEVFKIHRNTIEAAISQSTMDYGALKLNFQHDGVYLAATSVMAATHAYNNLVGSELLHKCMILLSILIVAGKEPDIPENIDLLQIRQYLNVPAKPIMIEVLNVLDSDLQFEDGSDAAEKLEFLRGEFIQYPRSIQYEKLQFYNFRLLKLVFPSNLRVFEVDFEGKPRTGNFQYYLNRIC